MASHGAGAGTFEYCNGSRSTRDMVDVDRRDEEENMLGSGRSARRTSLVLVPLAPGYERYRLRASMSTPLGERKTVELLRGRTQTHDGR